MRFVPQAEATANGLCKVDFRMSLLLAIGHAQQVIAAGLLCGHSKRGRIQAGAQSRTDLDLVRDDAAVAGTSLFSNSSVPPL